VALGQARALGDVLTESNMVAEGVDSTPAVLALARWAGVEMPVAEQVGAILSGARSPEDAGEALMGRDSPRSCTTWVAAVPVGLRRARHERRPPVVRDVRAQGRPTVVGDRDTPERVAGATGPAISIGRSPTVNW
jgi:hypothetical protein